MCCFVGSTQLVFGLEHLACTALTGKRMLLSATIISRDVVSTLIVTKVISACATEVVQV